MRVLGLAAVILVALAALTTVGCGGQPAVESSPGADAPEDLYVDWDLADWRVDRYILVNVRDFTTAQALGVREPAEAYRRAVTFEAVWDSLGLIPFLSLNHAEQADRRRVARRHVAEARRVVLGTTNHYWSEASRGYIPNLNAIDNAPVPLGVETAVTTALRHLVAATGVDPSNPAGWRDLAYFYGVVGDRPRQQRALGAALVSLDLVDPDGGVEGDVGRLRRDVFLDLAWLARDLRQPDLALAYLDHVQPWLRTPSPEREDRLFEAGVLRGLALADKGEWLAAVTQARDLPRVEVTSRSVRGSVREDLRWFLDAPHFEALGYDRSAWPRLLSDFGRRWIKAMAGAPSGDISHTLWILGPPPTHLEFPPRLASRYWQDQGVLYARAGDMENARHCFEWAMMYRPYMAFFPLTGSSSRPGRTARPGTAQRYYTSYGMFFLCGDRGAYERDVEPTLAARQRSAPGDLR
jgi:hypothetical protein